MKNIPIEHPGIILKEEFLEPYQITNYKLSTVTGISQSSLSKLIHGSRSFSLDTSARIGKALGLSLDYFLKLQIDYDLRNLQTSPPVALQNIQPIAIA